MEKIELGEAAILAHLHAAVKQAQAAFDQVFGIVGTRYKLGEGDGIDFATGEIKRKADEKTDGN